MSFLYQLKRMYFDMYVSTVKMHYILIPSIAGMQPQNVTRFHTTL